MAVPYTFGSATSSIPLSQLDSNFATTITLGNTAIQLGNTVTTLNNMTLANVTISSGTVTLPAQQANAVVYLNSSNVATANATLIGFDGNNLSLGGTLSAWDATSKAVQIGTQGAVEYRATGTSLINNIYYNAGWKYITTGYAALYNQYQNSHYWYSTNSGTANSAATLTQVLAVEKGKSLALEGANPQTGTGITFPASPNASSNVKTLDDYEEGTFTPTVTFSGGNGTLSYGFQIGSFTKIGNMVIVQIYISFVKGTASGDCSITNLPFTANSTSNAYGAASIRANNLTGISGGVTGYLLPGTTKFNLEYSGTGTVSTITNSNMFAGPDFIFQISYRI